MANNSINTNVGALIALQNLAATNHELSTAQTRVNTGLRVSSAKDNGAIWAVAQSQKADQSALDAVKNSISRGQSILDVALAAGTSVMDALKEMKNLAIAIESGGASGEDITAYQRDFDALILEMASVIGNATFDGVGAFTVSVGAIRTGLAPASVVDLGVNLAPPAPLQTGASVDAAITTVAIAMQSLGTQSKSLERSMIFASKLQDTLETGIGNLIDADLARESARLQALQTKQQLGVQALSIANQAPSILLGLFK